MRKLISLISLAQQLVASQSLPDYCFAISNSVFGSQTMLGEAFTHKDRIMKGDFTLQMRVSEFTGCRDSTGRFSGIQFKLSDPEGATLLLDSVGAVDANADCATYKLRAGDSISKMKVDWDTKGILAVAITAGKGVYVTFGESSPTSFSDSWSFAQDSQLVGVFGNYSKGQQRIVRQLGAIVFKRPCGKNAFLLTDAWQPMPLDGEAESGQDKKTSGVATAQTLPSLESSDSKGNIIIEVTPVTTTTEESEQKQTTPIIGAVVGAVIVLIVILVCCWLRNKKRSKILSELSIATMSTQETARKLNINSQQDEDLIADDRRLNRNPFDPIRVEEQGEDHIEGDLHRIEEDQRSIPELQHPENLQAISFKRKEAMPLSESEFEHAFSERPDSNRATVVFQEEMQHPPPSQSFSNQIDEESSVAVIIMQPEAVERIESRIGSFLPSIKDEQRRHVFTERTPDTNGNLTRRFQEIIDSEDETNGNGTQRIKKFRNQRDAFGDESALPIEEANREDEQESADGS